MGLLAEKMAERDAAAGEECYDGAPAETPPSNPCLKEEDSSERSCGSAGDRRRGEEACPHVRAGVAAAHRDPPDPPRSFPTRALPSGCRFPFDAHERPVVVVVAVDLVEVRQARGGQVWLGPRKRPRRGSSLIAQLPAGKGKAPAQ